jgi:hypothetical protein
MVLVEETWAIITSPDFGGLFGLQYLLPRLAKWSPLTLYQLPNELVDVSVFFGFSWEVGLNL